LAYFPNLVPPLKPTRTTSLTGKSAGGGPTQKQDTLAEWEGYRVFKDARSQTGWSDIAGHVVGGIDTHGYILLYNPATNHVDYNQHNHGGFDLGNLTALLSPGLAISNAASGQLSNAGVPVGTIQSALTSIPGVGTVAGGVLAAGGALGLTPAGGGGRSTGLAQGAGILSAVLKATGGGMGDVIQGPTQSGATVDGSTGVGGTASTDAFGSIAGKLAQSAALLDQLFGNSNNGGRANVGAVGAEVQGPTQGGQTLAGLLSGRNLVIGAAIVVAVFLIAKRK
jgi:hypothetical protein